MYTILGATGNTGSVAAHTLLDRGAKVRAVGRSREKLGGLAALGAELAVGDVHDSAFLTEALRGADGVYALVPPNYASSDVLGHYGHSAEILATAVKASGIRRLVVLSSLGAELETGSGPIVGLHGLEQALAATGADQLHLRPGYFFENFFGSLPLIRSLGINGGAIEPEAPVAMTATRDIGVAVADELLAGTFRGVEVRELTAERELSMRETTRLIGAAIGKQDLAYVHFPDADYAAGLVSAGLSADVARLFVEMSHAFNQGRIVRHQPKDGRTIAPTSFESFVPVLARAYAAE